MEYGLDHRSVKAMGYGRSRRLATHGPGDDGKENPADLDGRPILLGGDQDFPSPIATYSCEDICFCLRLITLCYVNAVGQQGSNNVDFRGHLTSRMPDELPNASRE
jgi:hypothetical protein